MNHSDFLPVLGPSTPEVKKFCDDWLAHAPLGDPAQACSAFLSLLDQLGRNSSFSDTHLEILERLRAPMTDMAFEQARKFAGKPLPLTERECAAFRQLTHFWMTMLDNYRRLLRDPSEAAAPARIALVAGRAVACASELICAHLLARQEVGPEMWQWLHSGYAFAEAQNVAQMPLNPLDPHETCAAYYAQALLLRLARPHGLSLRDAHWARAWAQRFAAKVVLSRGSGGAHAYAVDLGSGCGPRWMAVPPGPEAQADAALRFLDTQALGHALRRRLRRLEAGDSPAELGLGRSCTQAGAGSLLRALLRAWCAAPPSPRFPRRRVADSTVPVLAAVGFDAAHAAMSDAPFASEARAWEYSRRDAEHIQVFQRPAEPQDVSPASERRLENWEALNESARGFGLKRASAGARIAHGQLLAVKPADARQFILADARWITQGPGQTVTLGAQALPGLASACAARPATEVPSHPHPYSRAFMLPAAREIGCSLVLPMGWYQRERVLEVRLKEDHIRIRLCGLLARGYDYDHVSFVTA